jgi:hypothetical protein
VDKIDCEGILQDALFCCKETKVSSSEEQLQAIATEIRAMSERDQAMRKSGQWDSSIDVANTARMQEIVDRIGWPTVSKVGAQASSSAWLLVQHASHDRAFQKQCLALMQAQSASEVKPSHIAYLEDRVRMGEGQPQLYGTQFYTDEHGRFGPWPIEDVDNVDLRRASVGLSTLAEYTQEIENIHQGSSARSKETN